MGFCVTCGGAVVWCLGRGFVIVRFQVQAPARNKKKKATSVVSLDKALYSHCLNPPSCKMGTWLRLGRQSTARHTTFTIVVTLVRVGLWVPTTSVTVRLAPLMSNGPTSGGLSARAQISCSSAQESWETRRCDQLWQLKTLLLALCVCVCGGAVA